MRILSFLALIGLTFPFFETRGFSDAHWNRQNTPCPDQPKSLKELVSAFDQGGAPSKAEITGSWVKIGAYWENQSLNCSGLVRENKFVMTLEAQGYSALIDIWGYYHQESKFESDGKNNLSLRVDEGSDKIPIYLCRLTARRTLACLLGDPARNGIEFKKMSIPKNRRPKVLGSVEPPRSNE